ncbi:DUF599 domain-containing protein [Pararoseomonas indoligenes]|uniref:DUF599 domain-containing protein n=1 Tax=Roseomonas indoligenes TaxID=2820811 RepID=A0A940S4D5_9PROT|nr:DUF599 domain-containing protein [Pararoseomonas indoligenes]MBP0493196.1 DUF599 domain-containing protein [Pararoseomonas indoligenes]
MPGFLTPLDLVALAVFVLCWVGYATVVDRVPSIHRRSVIHAMNEHRRRWLVALLPKENRVADVAIVGNLMSSTSFLANTCIFIIGGAMALLASPEVGRRVLGAMPFSEAPMTDGGWETRILLILLIFVRAFFELTWALRQFNYGSILIGGLGRTPAAIPAAEIAAEVVNRAARHFNTGLRAYYFGLAVLAWMVHPIAFILASLWVVSELHRREFRSAVQAALSADG